MKPITYWDDKREKTLEQIRQLDIRVRGSYPVAVRPPRKWKKYPHKVRHLMWRKVYVRWVRAVQVMLGMKAKQAKLKKRLAYIEERIKATTPNFWSKL